MLASSSTYVTTTSINRTHHHGQAARVNKISKLWVQYRLWKFRGHGLIGQMAGQGHG